MTRSRFGAYNGLSDVNERGKESDEMFPPMTPTTERARVKNETRELERKAAQRAAMAGAMTVRVRFSWAGVRRMLTGLRRQLLSLRIELPRLRGNGQAKTAGKG